MFLNTVIKSTGAYVPSVVVPNSAFVERRFLDKAGRPIMKPTKAIVEKLEQITEISERRYERDGTTRHMASEAAREAMEKSGMDPEKLDGIIVAHNFGDIEPGERQGHMIPNLAAKVKHDLGIVNPKCFAFDVLFGCPGWLLAVDQAHQYIQNGRAKSVLVIGAELLSRVVDPHDIDSMLFGDGAGAALLVAGEDNEKSGLLGYESHSDCTEELDFLRMDKPLNGEGDELYINMTGRCVFKYAVNNLPVIITECLQRLDIPFAKVSQFLFHQANGKMIEAIGRKLSELNNNISIENKVPLIIQKLGNSSVATIPTLLDMILEGKLADYAIGKGDIVVMASVGAGMHANCLVHKF